MYFLFQQKQIGQSFTADVERGLADWQPYRKRTLNLQLRKAVKSFNHSYNFGWPNMSDEANATAHQEDPLSEDAQGEESPTQSPGKRLCMKDALIAGKKTKHSGIKRSSTDIQKKNCKAGTLEWEENSVIMQNVNHHVKQVNRYIREVWKWSKARTSPTPVKQHTERHREREQEQRIAGR